MEHKEYTKYGFNAGEVLKQLGGNKFIAMTGAKHFFKDDSEARLSFKIVKNCKGVNYVNIKLNSMDLYDIEFSSIRGLNTTLKSKATGVYNDQLQSVFTENTGMETHL